MRYWLCLLVALALLCLPAGAAELPKELTDALPSQAERLLEGETGDLLGGMSALGGNLRQEAGKILRSRLKTAAGVLFVVLLCAVLGGLREGGAVPDFVPMGGALAIAALTAGSLKNLVGFGWEAMEATSVFGKALLGALAVSLAAGGAVQTASFQQVGTVLFGTFLLELIRTLLLPLVYLYAATVTAAAIAPETPLRSLAEAIRKAVSWALGGSLAAFTLYLTLTGAVSGAADQAAVRAAKAVLSGTVPVVGGILSDAAETLLAGAGVLRGGIGIFGTLGVLAICAYPFLHLGIQYLLYRGAGFLAEAAGGGPLPKLIGGLGSAFALVLGMTASCAAVIIVAIAAAMGVAGL
ncbi:MAG: stage III sporulation protein AE [Dysosmobacter sp.]|nr:stage III sporulation protein AE [Dysosmobacter sp.]